MTLEHNSIAHLYCLWMTLEHKRGFWESFQQEKIEKENCSFVAVFFSDQQRPDRVSRLTNRWIGIKFGLSVPDIFVVDLNVGDHIHRSERSCSRSWTEAGFGWCFFLFIFCWCSYCLFSFDTCCVDIRRIFLTLLLL